MRAIIRWGGGLLGTVLAASVSLGYTWVHPVTRQPIPPAPDACGPGFYLYNHLGMAYGPSYYLVPPWQPFQGWVPVPDGLALMQAKHTGRRGPQLPMPPMPASPQYMPPQLPSFYNGCGPYGPGMGGPGMGGPGMGGAGQGQGAYPTHPWARSPRDFFMWNEQMEEQNGRDVRPNFVP
jgi:hypothetical protein